MSKEIRLGRLTLGEGRPCLMAAEIGINHNGDMGLALEMIDAAAESGANAVKFQNYVTEDFIHDRSLTYTYVSRGKTVTESQYDMFKRYELTPEQLVLLKERCDDRGVVFFSTPTSPEGVNILKELGAPLLKNGSDYLVNLELVEAMGASGLPTVLSTGMALPGEIEDAVNAFAGAGGRECVLLHCTSSYPTPPEDVNLRAIPSLARRFGRLVGLSDHSQGGMAALGAVALGACMVEKHFTLDKELPGPDQWFSSSPDEFREMVDGVRDLEKRLGSAELGPAPSDMANRESFRLSCVAAGTLTTGRVLERGDVVFRRPGTGIPPKDVGRLVGRTLTRAIESGAVITEEDLV